jgi:hypothetical protein
MPSIMWPTEEQRELSAKGFNERIDFLQQWKKESDEVVLLIPTLPPEDLGAYAAMGAIVENELQLLLDTIKSGNAAIQATLQGQT